MNHQYRVFGFLAGIAIVAGVAAACSNTAGQCENTGTCPIEGSGGTGGKSTATSSGGVTSSGGNTTSTSGGTTSSSGGSAGAGGSVAVGGSSTAGSGGSNSGGAPSAGATAAGGTAGNAGQMSVSCGGACNGATPFCKPATNLCVGCLESTDCRDASKPLCDKTTTNSCVSCLTNADCPNATAPLCNATTHSCGPCAVDNDCSAIAGKPVCLFNAATGNVCVQCTGKKASACGGFVCDSTKHSCTTDKAPQSAGLCQECVSDAQCKAGQACVQESFQGSSTGHYCFWRQGGGSGAPTVCGSSSRPFFNGSTTSSIDGEAGMYCTLAASTCKAYNQYRTNCTATGGGPDLTLCGVSMGQDSSCVETRVGSGEYNCTMACLGPDDCLAGVSCLTGTTPRLCSLSTTTGTGGTSSTGTAGTAGR